MLLIMSPYHLSRRTFMKNSAVVGASLVSMPFSTLEELCGDPVSTNVFDFKNPPCSYFLPAQREVHDTSLVPSLLDIESHMADEDHVYRKDDTGLLYNQLTWAHETTHGINKNERSKLGHLTFNAFYVLYNNVVRLREPNMAKKNIAEFVPDIFKQNGMCEYYIVQNQGFDMCPLYVFDEWSSYTNGVVCGIENMQQGNITTEQEALHFKGSVELLRYFDVFSIATAMATRQYDRKYWESNDGNDLRDFTSWQLERTGILFKQAQQLIKENGNDVFVIRDAEGMISSRTPMFYLSKLPGAEAIREFSLEFFDKDWAKEGP